MICSRASCGSPESMGIRFVYHVDDQYNWDIGKEQQYFDIRSQMQILPPYTGDSSRVPHGRESTWPLPMGERPEIRRPYRRVAEGGPQMKLELRSHTWVRYILAVALGAPGLACRSGKPTASQRSVPSASQLQDCVTKMRLVLPSDVRVLGWKKMAGMDDIVFLKISIKPTDVPSFLSSSPFANVPLSRSQQYLHDDDAGEEWWKPSGSQRYRSGQVTLPAAEVLSILLDESDPDSQVVYLMWHET